ncbi:microtubule-associated proteins 1A/1B light chain 3C [Octodon degus]|uniref:Microtubule-associated proteins 1A/1B light chain 3C n=1 Tax=Octodon degus TaxID=10160 RepID=A0A6P3V9K8_OCTDE|nr:microtubule-associated proteins 1A/1B light chain 3C [Octodon degus]
MSSPLATPRSLKPFKKRKSFATRQEEVAGILAKFPNKVPVILERDPRERSLPLLDKTKFLVPRELTMTQFLGIIQSRMALRATEAFYLLVNNQTLVSTSVTMAEIYRDHKDEDGFVYMTYTSQETFGCPGTAAPRAGGRSKVLSIPRKAGAALENPYTAALPCIRNSELWLQTAKAGGGVHLELGSSLASLEPGCGTRTSMMVTFCKPKLSPGLMVG